MKEHWDCWMLPKHLSHACAVEHFVEKVKPRTYKLDVFKYNPHSGVARTLEEK